MKALEVSYEAIEEWPIGADRMFMVMMRLEFALKEIGYCRRARNGSAEVDWDKFAKERLGAPFFDLICAAGNARTLIHSPPKRQTVDGSGALAWEQTGEVSNVQELLGAMRRVRNNLFHGGKSGDPDGDRNEELIANALSLIDAMLQENSDLQSIFEGKY